MTPAELTAALELATEAKARAGKATEGPWYGGKGDVWTNPDGCIVDSDCGWHGVGREEDGEFIGHARTDVPALADAVARLVERVRELEGALVRIRDLWPGETEETFDALDEAVTVAEQVLPKEPKP